MSAYESLERSIKRTGKATQALLLNATAEQMKSLAQAQEDAAEHYGKRSHGYHIHRNSARILKKMARIIEMHALYHIGDEPTKVTAIEKRAFFGSKKKSPSNG